MLRRGRVEVTGGFLLLAAWLNYSDDQGLLPWALAAAAAHELGHWAAIRLLGGRVTRLRLSAVGAELRLETPMSYWRELICALAGPGVNLLLALWAVQAGEAGWLFAGMNLALGCFNLLPVRGLDGGRALFCVLACVLGQEWADRLCGGLDKVLVGLLAVAGGAVLRMGGNFTLLLIALWLGAAIGKKLPQRGLSRAVGTGKMVRVKRRG